CVLCAEITGDVCWYPTRRSFDLPVWEPGNLAIGYRSRAITFRGKLARAAHRFGVGDRWGSPLDQYWAEDGPWWNLRATGGLLSRSEEHTSELQSRENIVCRLLLE